LKIKTDFITNSSSTAFIVVWPNIVETLEDVNKFISNTQHAQIIFDDIMGQSINKIDINDPKVLSKVWSEMEEGWIRNVTVDYDIFMKNFAKLHNITTEQLQLNHTWRGQFWDAYRAEQQNQATQKSIEFLEPHGGQYVYFFSYSDNDGQIFSDLEHENDWGGLPHVRISHH